ncbi:MAG: DsbA family protein [Alphaproteobacteria bacterium]|nr:DsbA family protein [Alphaproteobacteria bacterium]
MSATKTTSGSKGVRGAAVLGVALIGAAIGYAGWNATATAEGPADKAKLAKAAAVFSSEQKAGIEAIVRQYLLDNPELFLEVQTALEAKMEKLQADRMKTAIKSNADALYRRTDAPMAGNPKGDITIVEFFDYNCGFCKRGFTEVNKLLKADDKVRVVLKELPILSKGSEEASRVALAAKKQGKYWEVHQALLNHRGAVDGASALKIAGKLGLDVAKLKSDTDSKEVTAEINTVRELAQKMNINGTPHFLVGDRAIPGAPENLMEQLSNHVKDLRKNGCEVC